MEQNRCAVCDSESVTPVCDDCMGVFRRNGIIVRTKEDAEHWKEWVDLPTEREIKKQLCDKLNF